MIENQNEPSNSQGQAKFLSDKPLTADYDHNDLAANMWTNEAELNGDPNVDDDGNGYVDDIYGYHFANDNGDPRDISGHGTMCAGIIGAVGDNNEGVTGVCWNVKIMALNVGGLNYEKERKNCRVLNFHRDYLCADFPCIQDFYQE